MTDASVKIFEELSKTEGPYKPRTSTPSRVRSVEGLLPPTMRLIYFDERRAVEILEHIASSPSGLTRLDEVAKRAKAAWPDSAVVLREHDQRAILSQLITDMNKLGTGFVDLHQPDDALTQISWNQLHPDQAIAVRGAVVSAKDVQLSSLRLEGEDTSVRVYVERDHFLHLNKSYLARQQILTVVGKVRSVPNEEVCAAVIGTISTDS